MSDEGRRIDSWTQIETGVPVDIGWGVAVLNPDDTVTRTCKGCAVSVTSPVERHGSVVKVEQRPITHRSNCPVLKRLGNNPGLS
jgi:hypothetical protein